MQGVEIEITLFFASCIADLSGVGCDLRIGRFEKEMQAERGVETRGGEHAETA